MRTRGWVLLVSAAGALLAGSLAPARALPDPPSLDPPHGRLALTLMVGTVRQVFTVDPRLGDYRQITNVAAGARDPDWSPDTTLIAFSSGGALWTVPSTGGTPTRVTNPAAGTWDLDPRWSPDGQTLAFVRSPSASSSFIYLVAPDGTGLRQLVATPTVQYEPRWTPDGYLSYTAVGRHSQVYLADPSGRTSAPLVQREGEYHASGASWRADGRLSYLQRTFYEDSGGEPTYTNAESWLARDDGTGPNRWIAGPSAMAAWTNDSRCMAYETGYDWGYSGWTNSAVHVGCGGTTLTVYRESRAQPPGLVVSTVIYGALDPDWMPTGPTPVDPALVDRSVVGGNGVTTWSSGSLVVGQRYEIVARGTYSYGPGGARADAECSSGAAADPVFIPRRHQWQDLNGDPLDLYVGGHQHDDWEADDADALGCSPTHTYRLAFTAASSEPISFRLVDSEPSDNYGVLRVEIRRI